MTNKFENINSEEIKLNELGEIELSQELQDAVAGGFSPEEEEDAEGNICPTINIGCDKQLQ